MSAYMWALITAVVWGVVPMMEKTGLGQASPAAGVAVRSLGVLLGLVVLTLAGSPWAAARALSAQSVLLLMAGGFLASFVGQMAFYQALKSGAVSQVTPVAGAYPLISVLLGWMILREPFTWPRALGALCVVAGIVLLRK
jgi:transporter family protein